MTAIHSKLPEVGTTIFTVMSALAAKHGALNLAQGFPDYPIDPKLPELVQKYMRAGCNQYAPMAGVPQLRQRIAEKFRRVHGLDVDADSEITVTAGGTQALFTAIAALIRPGDEVLVFEPAYDSYAPVVRLFGGKVVPVRLVAPDFAIDWAKVLTLVNENTRLVIVNHPSNPACRVFSEQDIDALAHLAAEADVPVLSDEVYEHLVYDGRQPQTLLRHPLLRGRTFAVASFGKLLHATGWKVGYCTAAPEWTAEFRKVHQFNVFSVHTPTQLAIAEYLENADHYLHLGEFFQAKRDRLAAALQTSRLRVLPSQGTYFMNVDYSAVSDAPEAEFAQTLVAEHGIAAIPLSAFYHDGFSQHCLRLCFAKEDATLDRAAQLLNRV